MVVMAPKRNDELSELDTALSKLSTSFAQYREKYPKKVSDTGNRRARLRLVRMQLEKTSDDSR